MINPKDFTDLEIAMNLDGWAAERDKEKPGAIGPHLTTLLREAANRIRAPSPPLATALHEPNPPGGEDGLVEAAKSLNAAVDQMWNEGGSSKLDNSRIVLEICNAQRRLADALSSRPAHGVGEVFASDLWHEDYGSVLWWRFPVQEPPYSGSPLDEDWPGYHTHWTLCRAPLPPEGWADPQPKEQR